MKQESGHVVVMSTTDSVDEAKRLARSAVTEHLAACVQVMPISSTYAWEGRIVEDDEFLLLFKTSADAAERLRGLLESIHGYDVPEVLELPVSAGSAAYLDWLTESTRRRGPDGPAIEDGAATEEAAETD